MMLKRIIPLVFFAFAFVQAQAQYPEPLGTSGPSSLSNASLVCPPGANPDAGTSTQSADQSIFPNNQTNTDQFLCLGDSLQVLHSGGSLSGDPDPSTPPGFSYIFYRCPPSNLFNGPDLATVLMDPCHYQAAPATQLTTVQPPTTPIVASGDATFFNDGSLQALNGGGPISIWFAPFTVDQFVDTPGSEAVNMENNGACMDVNTDDAFNVIYLNPITITNLNNNAGSNGCSGEMTLSGGLAEFRAGATGPDKLYDVNITKVSDPTVVGFPTNAWQHGQTLTFRVPEAGLYEISVEDGVSCGATAQVMMGACTPTVFTFGDSLATMGSNICMPIVVENFIDIWSFEFNLEWDPAILDYTPPLIAGDLDDSFLQINHPVPGPGGARIIWFEPTLGSVPVTLMDGQIAFEICFDVIGTPGQSSPIRFGANDFAVATVNSLDGSFIAENGSVTIVSNNMTLDFTSCSSSSSAAMDEGSFIVTVTGGLGPYSFVYEEVGNPSNTGTGMIPSTDGSGEVTGLPPGTYNIVVTDINGDIQAGTVTIADAPSLFVRINPFVDPSCDGFADGSVTLEQLGGVGPFDIEWSTGDMNISMVSGLGNGQYSVSVTDANGCMKSSMAGIAGPPAITIDTTVVNVSCAGGPSDGSITVSPMGGPPPNVYTYLWDNGNTTNSISNLPAGTYCVDISSGGCSNNFCIEVFDPLPPVITGADSTSISCPGANDASLTVLYTPGFGNVTDADITWDNGGTGPTITGLAPGDYTVTITASDGCTATETFTIGSGGYSISLNVNTNTCSYTTDGFISVTVTPPPGPNFTYLWSNGGTGSFISDLVCGQTYSVTVSDGSACPGLVESVDLICPPDILITFDPNSIEPVSCFGLSQPLCDGAATVIASSGTTNSGDYNFQWENTESQMGGSQHDAVQLCQGWNTVTISDLACFAIDSVFIPAPEELQLNLDSNEIVRPSCFGDDDGSISIAAQGGTSPYDYNWNIGQNGQMIDGLTVGNYTVTITDLENCSHTVSIPLEEPDPLVAAINPDNTADAKCNDSEDGQIEVIWTGGNQGNATFDWDPSVSNSNFAAGLAPGLYTIVVTDEKGCSDEISHVVSNPPPINFQIVPPVEPPCFGETTVIKIASISGGSGEPYQFSVGGGLRDTSQAIRVLAGPITVTVFDSEKCTADTNIVINQPPEIIVDLGPEIEEIDLGSSTIIDANISPPNLQLEALIWTPTTNLICEDLINNDSLLCNEVEVSPLNTTTYTLTAVDVNGCEGEGSIIIDVDKNRNVFIPNAFSPNDDAYNDVFRVLGGAGVERVSYMRIFDRWGELLHQELDFIPLIGNDAAWDGTFRGKKVNPGVYVYLVEVVFIDGVRLLYRGDITLLY